MIKSMGLENLHGIQEISIRVITIKMSVMDMVKCTLLMEQYTKAIGQEVCKQVKPL